MRDVLRLAFELAVIAAMVVAVFSVAAVWRGDVGEGGGPRYVPSASVRVWLDPETGCEYFSDSWRPRLDREGKQICSAEGVSK